MERDEVKIRLNGIFRDIFEDDSIEIRDDMTAEDIEAWDSLNHVNLIVAVEKTFGIKMTTKEVNSLKNVGELVGVVQRKAVSKVPTA